MIKIEKLSPGCIVTFKRNGVTQPAFLHQMLTNEEFETLVVEKGNLLYSVDELEVESIEAVEPAPAPSPAPAPVAKPAAKTTAKK